MPGIGPVLGLVLVPVRDPVLGIALGTVLKGWGDGRWARGLGRWVLGVGALGSDFLAFFQPFFSFEIFSKANKKIFFASFLCFRVK